MADPVAEKPAEVKADDVDAKARAADLQKELDRVTKKLQSKLDAEEKEKQTALAEQGKYKELYEGAEAKFKADAAAKEAELAKAQGELAKVQEERAKQREALINKFTDPKLKELASKLTELSDVQAFVDIYTNPKSHVFSGNLQGGAPEKQVFKSIQEYEAALTKIGRL